MKFSICDSDYNIIRPIDLDRRGITKLLFKSSTNKPNELTFEFNQNLGGLYDYLLNKEDVLVRLDFDDINLAFYKSKDSIKKTGQGNIQANLVSTSYLLSTNRPYIPVNGINFAVLQDSFQNLVTQTDPNFEYLFLGEDKTDLILQRGLLTNYQIINELCDQTQYSWRDDGIIYKGGRWRPQILIGDFEKIESLGVINKYKTQYAININNYANKVDPNYNIIVEPPIINKTESYSLCLPYGTSNSGLNSNTVFLPNQNFSWIDQKYPLTVVDGNVYILNSNYKPQRERILYQPISLAVNSQNGAELTNLLTDEQVYKYIYNKALSEFKRKISAQNFTFKIVFQNLFLAGNKIKIKYREYSKQKGKTVTSLKIETTQTYNEVTFDLSSFIRN
jgi:hypothetical protein